MVCKQRAAVAMEAIGTGRWAIGIRLAIKELHSQGFFCRETFYPRFKSIEFAVAAAQNREHKLL